MGQCSCVECCVLLVGCYSVVRLTGLEPSLAGHVGRCKQTHTHCASVAGQHPGCTSTVGALRTMPCVVPGAKHAMPCSVVRCVPQLGGGGCCCCALFTVLVCAYAALLVAGHVQSNCCWGTLVCVYNNALLRLQRSYHACCSCEVAPVPCGALSGVLRKLGGLLRGL